MKRPEIKNYKNITGAGAYDYVADVNEYMNHLEKQLELFAIPVVIESVCNHNHSQPIPFLKKHLCLKCEQLFIKQTVL